MGHKVHPYSFRLGYIQGWQSSWFVDRKKFADTLIQDVKIREFISTKLASASVSKTEIERTSNGIVVSVYTAKPGMVLGKNNQQSADLTKELCVLLQTRKVELRVKEVKRPDLDAQVVASSVASAIERRISYRRAMKQVVQKAMESGAKGIKVYVGGRLNGAEISRGEFVSEGRIPLQTLRADIDYAKATALTTYGKLGIKVWIYKGDVFQKTSSHN